MRWPRRLVYIRAALLRQASIVAIMCFCRIPTDARYELALRAERKRVYKFRAVARVSTGYARQRLILHPDPCQVETDAGP